ncbi:hypothetical protein L4D20_03710 [Vibrio kyushuensis]|uniref:hypothetical protein n=1 Tax=Vibrio kyushuensis TaxID=2910249 RepID=UPI003D126A82
MQSLDLTKLQEWNRLKWKRVQQRKQHETELEEIEQETERLKQLLESEKLVSDIADAKTDQSTATLSDEHAEAISALHAQQRLAIEQEKLKAMQYEADSKLRDLERAEERLNSKAKERRWRTKQKRAAFWLNQLLKAFVLLLIAALLAIGVYRAYRWATEEPLIKEVLTEVEVEKIIEKEVEVETIVEKEVEIIPDECTQIRRNGQIFIDCDGTKIDGVNTIGDSGITDVPELLGD